MRQIFALKFEAIEDRGNILEVEGESKIGNVNERNLYKFSKDINKGGYFFPFLGYSL